MKQIKLSDSQVKIINAFTKMYNKKNVCPTMLQLSLSVKMSPEHVRTIMLKLVDFKLVKINKKLKNRKFSI